MNDVQGWTAAATFYRLAVQLLTVAARRWWSPDVTPDMTEFGEALLRNAQQAAERDGQWYYAPSGQQDWADVTVTYHPIGEPPPKPKELLPQ
ncbi:hypothetical protein [Kitasatospora sp. NPDC001527]|uniref:hypothetical protein n=1 Tax=Kitasatospora sp. NPDC001527 TaxID=3154519 RepID=UPI00332A7E22